MVKSIFSDGDREDAMNRPCAVCGVRGGHSCRATGSHGKARGEPLGHPHEARVTGRFKSGRKAEPPTRKKKSTWLNPAPPPAQPKKSWFSAPPPPPPPKKWWQ